MQVLKELHKIENAAYFRRRKNTKQPLESYLKQKYHEVFGEQQFEFVGLNIAE